MQFSDTFRAMDTEIDAVLELDSPIRPLDAFLSLNLLFEQQEDRFSRFRPRSALSRLNRGEIIDDPLFARGCELALEAHRFSGGLYNPMVLHALEQAGYDRTFSEVHGGEPVRQEIPDPHECLRITGSRVQLVRGALDLGGIVKGWTVDLAVELLEGRFTDVFINAGGDLRCTGSEGGRDGWSVAVDDPSGAGALWQGTIRGALATSTTRKRRWLTASGSVAHHLIDPRTGLPANSPVEQVTAWAAEAWRAECWAKAVLIGGPDAAVNASAAGIRLLALGIDGEVARWNL